jgi:exopolysaccharide biosynthesis WecB/TagA/CpsF family protein
MLPPATDTPAEQRFLLVQLGDIGDLILTTPAIAALRAAHPAAHLALLTASHAAQVIEKSLIDDLLTFDRRGFNNSLAFFRPANLRRIGQLRAGKYTTVIFFHHFTLKLGTLKFALIAKATGADKIIGLENGNAWFLTDTLPDEGFGARHQTEYWLELVGLCGASVQPQRARIAFDDGILPLAAYHGQRVVLHPGSGGYSLARRWSPEAFAHVADTLHQEFNAQIVFVGTPDDGAEKVLAAMHTPAVDLTGKTSLTQLADVLRSADLYIGADSGVSHLAAAVRTPMLAIFGPSNHHAYAPWSPGGQLTILRSAPECSPCSYVGHSVGLREGCAARTCMKMVTPEMVLHSARQILKDEPVTIAAPHLTLRAENDKIPRWHDTLRLLNIPIDRITYADWMALIEKWVKHGKRAHHVCTTNPEFLVLAQRDFNFKNILQRADLCIPDGVGLLWAARIIGSELPERVTGSDGTVIIAEHAAKKGWRLFLLGAAPGIADKAAEILCEQFPALQIVGVYAGSPAPEDEDSIVEKINASNADIVLVAYGAPEQDKWIARNLPRLRVKMAMGIGGALDFIAGVVPRAPETMRRYGLEWLYRLYKQPWRIRRMLRLPVFVLLVILRGEK